MPPTVDIAHLVARLEALEGEVRQSRDLEEIRELAHVYQSLCDGGWNGPSHRDPDALTALFTPDATYILPVLPPATGHAQIRDLFVKLQQYVPWIIHFQMNPLFEVDGDTARGEIKCVTTAWSMGERRLMFGTYFGEFARTGAGWRFTRWEYVRASPS